MCHQAEQGRKGEWEPLLLKGFQNKLAAQAWDFQSWFCLEARGEAPVGPSSVCGGRPRAQLGMGQGLSCEKAELRGFPQPVSPGTWPRSERGGKDSIVKAKLEALSLRVPIHQECDVSSTVLGFRGTGNRRDARHR